MFTQSRRQNKCMKLVMGGLISISPAAHADPEQAASITNRLSAYKENYFDIAAKNLGRSSISTWQFKVGVKTPVFERSSPSDAIYLGYRMTGYWDIDADSAPFRDINHNPSLFWLKHIDSPAHALKGWELGVEHISNGQDNTSTGPMDTGTQRSRSVDAALFFEPKLLLLKGSLVVQPKLWIPWGTGENPAIRHEWGLLWNTLTYSDVLEISTKGNPFNDGQASIKVHHDLSDLIKSWTGKEHVTGIKASLTLFNGRGDGLLDNTQRKTWVRLGFTFNLYKD